ncbi:MAG TPA: LamG-like jellyroll fold domain-containing protein, partial [Pyrinomonadaceae bacterium]|nr:LamG-like jellyroll fold domain-containing protein [Pyrinomonadaceae bacterium]
KGRVFVVEEGSATPKPLPGVYVTSDGYDLAQTDGQGNYNLPRVSPNTQLTLRFILVNKAYGYNLDVRLSPGETLTRDVTFRPGTIRGRVTQPDGVTGVVADVSVYTQKPYLKAGPNLGLLTTESPAVTHTGADGSYTVSGLNPGAFRVSTSNVFFPTHVSAGGVLAPNGTAECNLSLVSTLAGKIQGRVYQPDGTTPVGANVRVTLGGGSLADAAVRTDETGHYEFGEVFSAGSYTLTATDLVTGYTNRISVSVQKNQDAVFDLRLLGNGSLRVKVVGGGGQPVDSGTISLNGSAFPHQRRFAEMTEAGAGVVVFDNLPEGPYAVSATRLGLGGRAAVNVAAGSTVETTIQLLASGSVEGHVYMPFGTTPVGLADVQLTANGRSIGFAVTSDDAADAGKFQFANVPAGDFTLDVFDNRTGRVGRSYGTITSQGQTAAVDVYLLAVGAVAGRVTANGLPVDHALVEISSDGSGLVRTALKATTDADGRYRFAGIPAGRFTVNVKDAPGGQTGTVSGTVSGTNEPLPDTVADIALEASQTVTGTVYKLGGTEPVPGALVTLDVNNRRYSTNTNEQGVYRVGFIPLGQVRVRANAPAGNDRGEAAPVTGATPGGTVTADVTFAGTGDVSGLALDSNGAPLSLGEVAFTNSAWGSQVRVSTSMRADGRYEFKGVPAGAFTLKLTVTGRVGSGNASGTALAGQNLDVALRLEDAGRVTGRLLNESGGAPAAGVDVTLTLSRACCGSLTFYTHSDSQGVWSFDNLPLGTVNVSMSDTETGGLAQLSGLALSANGQVLDTGDVHIDSTPISVTAVAPAAGATNVPPVNATVTVNFSEAANPSTVNAGTVRLLSGTSGVGSSVSLSADKRVATLTPNLRLADTTLYTVQVTTGVKDLSGLRLASEFRSAFTTGDATAPSVASVSPANDAAHVALDASVTVNFGEPLDAAQPPGDVVKLAAADGQPVAGTYTRGADLRSITLKPSAPLAEGSRYNVSAAGQRDAAGNAQAGGFTSSFTTLDQTPPVIDPLPIDGKRVRTFRPVVTATYRDNLSGVKTSTVVLTLDGANVTAGASVTGTGLSYTPASPLTRGDHTVTLRASDNDGNQSAARTATFNVDDSGPIITGFTVAGQPATNGMFVTSTLQPVINVTYNDDTGADADASKLLIGFRGATPQPVAASVTGTGITYQSPTPMAEGAYTVEAVVVNGLGTSTSTGRVTFTLDVDAPEITSVTPPSGSQHGGTTLTVTGNRLMSGVAAQGLTGRYYDNIDFTGAEIVRVDPVVNFNWDTGSPDASMGSDQFSVRWTGQVQAQTTEDYTFYTFSDDGVRLYVNNQLVINNWTDHAPVENSAVFPMAAGQKYDIRVECYENGGGALMALSWSSASVAKQIVPQTALTSSGLAPQVNVGGAAARVLGITAGSPDVMTVDTPAGAPGPADVEVITDRGRGLASGAFTYTPDPRTPFALEPDTLVLWHLDELGNGAVNIDDAAGLVTASAGSASTAQPGRFSRGRARANIASGQDVENVLTLGNKSFTLECWMKTGALGRTYTLVGKDHQTNGSTSYVYGNFSLQALPGGSLRAFYYDAGNSKRQVDMPAATMRVDDDQWHHVAMVVDRDSARLLIYVDGAERAAASVAGATGVTTYNDYPLRAGHYDSNGPVVTNTTAPLEFPGTLDEVRLSSTAHSAEAVRQTYLGTEGTLGLVVLGATPYTLPRGTTVTVDVSGYNLSGVTAAVTDAAGVPQQTRTVHSSANAARIEVAVSPSAALGTGQLVLSSAAGTVSSQVLFVEVGQSAYGAESDTRLLWHLDETSGTRVSDSSTYSIDGAAAANSSVVDGRFGLGRKRANLTSDDDNDMLEFGNTSFTAECWVKTGRVERTYTLVGKDHQTNGSTSYVYGNFSLQIMPAGGLRAFYYDAGNSKRQTQMPATAYDVDDDRWHHVAMVVDREAARLSIYVDGVERSFVSIAGATGMTTYNDYPLRAGHYDSNGPVITNTSAPLEFPGTLDEVRLSSTAHAAARLKADFDGNAALSVNSVQPREVQRNKNSAQRVPATVNVDGYDLSGVAARVERQGVILDVTVSVAESSYRSARLELGVGPNVVLGPSKLVFSKPGRADVSADLYIAEKSELTLDNDTVVLWRLNETQDGQATIVDSSPLSIEGHADAVSKARDGRFLGGRSLANIQSEDDFGALDFGSKSFTTECWVKTPPVERTYTLVGKDHQTNGSTSYVYGNFSLQLMPSGGLRAFYYDAGNSRRQADMLPTAYDVDDGQWHHVAMVVNREAARLSIYVDGVERSFVSIAGATGMTTYNDYPLRAGHYDSNGPVVTNTTAATQFPGTLDEIRVSATAHSPERILADALGYDAIRLVRVLPSSLQRGASNVPVTITGNGLSNVTLTTDRPGVGVQLVSTDATQVKALVTLPASSALGTLTLTATNLLGQTASITDEVVDQKPFANAADDNNNTLVLWHLDETANGPAPFNGSGDPVPSVIGGTPSANAASVPARFGNGKALAGITGSSQSNTLLLGNSSFTAECWVKTAPVERTYTLVGKDHPTNGSTSYVYGIFSLQIMPGGSLRAFYYDAGNSRRMAEMTPKTFDTSTGQWLAVLDDEQWHHVAMVVDRTLARLSIYVDGVERSFVSIAGATGVTTYNEYPFRAGHYDSNGPNLPNTAAALDFPGTLDEVRVSKFARTAAEIRQTWTGSSSSQGGAAPSANQMRATPADADADAARPDTTPSTRVISATPDSVERDKAAPGAHVTELTVAGAGLKGVSARLAREDRPLDAKVEVLESSEESARLRVSVGASVPLGAAQLVLSKRGQTGAIAMLQVTEPSEFAVEADTALLWHMDEAEQGAARFRDSGAAALEAVADATSAAAEGRFGAGRALARAAAQLPQPDSLAASKEGFTVEGWFKSEPVKRDYILVGKGADRGSQTDWALSLLPSGALRAAVHDVSGIEWRADTSEAGVRFDDGRWHSAAAVLDRTTNSLFVYVDGRLYAVAAMPLEFGVARASGQSVLLGVCDFDGAAGEGPDAFPGALDEVRVSSTPHALGKVAADFFGHDAPQVTYASPAPLAAGPQPAPVTLHGYGLAGAKVAAVGADVKAVVKSSTRTRVELLVSAPAGTPAGAVRFEVTDPLGQTASFELEVRERAGAKAPGKEPTPARAAVPAPTPAGRRASRAAPPPPAEPEGRAYGARGAGGLRR